MTKLRLSTAVGLAGRQALASACAALCVALAGAAPAQAQDAAALTARHTALREALKNNVFQRPLVLESHEAPELLRGDIYARVDQPFAVVGAALQGVDHWCDIMMLHLNVKQCRATDAAGNGKLAMVIGAKHNVPVADAYHFEFDHKVVVSQPDYLQVVMDADKGPLGTHHYLITLEVVALDAGKSFLHLSYAYGHGMVARAAMRLYLATAGRAKVGFSVDGVDAAGQPRFIHGNRGVVERNTMRYYLAIEAYLGALSSPPAQQLEKRLNDWYAGVERYPLQLHELTRDEYLDLKHRQLQQQQASGG
jgi:hypothetical protein